MNPQLISRLLDAFMVVYWARARARAHFCSSPGLIRPRLPDHGKQLNGITGLVVAALELRRELEAETLVDLYVGRGAARLEVARHALGVGPVRHRFHQQTPDAGALGLRQHHRDVKEVVAPGIGPYR